MTCIRCGETFADGLGKKKCPVCGWEFGKPRTETEPVTTKGKRSTLSKD